MPPKSQKNQNPVSAEELSGILDDKLSPLYDQIADAVNKLDSFVTKEEVSDLVTKAVDEAVSDVKKTVQELSERCNALEQTNGKLQEAIKHQQAYMERMDAKDREKNLILRGVPTGTYDERTTDEEKVMHVMEIINVPRINITCGSLKRVGSVNPDNPATPRPILLSVASRQERDQIVNLARQGDITRLGGIQVNKDLHPSVCKEWKRLFTVKEEEERKAENASHAITIDFRKRQVLRDGEVIDSWNLLFRGPK
jgi:hypothetical protein